MVGFIRELIPDSIINFISGYNRIHGFLIQSETWNEQQIRVWQLHKLQSLVKFAYEHIDGYRQLYNEYGVKPEDLRSLDDFCNFPFVNKELIRNNLSSFSTKKTLWNGNGIVTTGGSTGIPFEFYQDRLNTIAETAFINYTWESIGWHPDSTGVKVRGAHIGTPSNILKQISKNRYAISSSFLTEGNYSRYIEAILSIKASFIHAYPSSLTDLSQLIVRHGDADKLNIKYIFLGSENFYPWQESIIRSAFPSAKLLSFYGMSEHTVLASWCEHNKKYHINPFYGFTEIIDGNGSNVDVGCEGEIVGTSFWNKGTIFIRYRSGDRATMGEIGCDGCGKHFQLLDSIDGRLAEFVVGETGRRISLTVFAGSIMHGKTFEHIKQFRFVQYEKGKLEMNIIPCFGFENSDMENLSESLKSFLGNDFECNIKIVDSLPLSKRGKYSYLEQHLKVERADINL